MTTDNADKDTTRVRPPGRDTGSIPKRYQASIVIIKGHAEGMEYPVTKEYTVIGRDKTSDIAIKDQMVSRQHAAIVYHEGGFTLKDLGSTNGTMMNSRIIEVAPIRHRDKFRIGDTTIQFIVEETSKGNTYEIEE